MEEQLSRLIFVKDTTVIGTYSYPLGEEAADEAKRIAAYVLDENEWLTQIGNFREIRLIDGKVENRELRGASLLWQYKKELSF
jgi:hypothetical protein